MEPSSIRFARDVRRLADAARRHGLRVPTFRSPPGVPGAVRTVRRRGSGATTVAVAWRGRPWAAVQADLVEGVVVANGLDPAAAEAARSALWAGIGDGAEGEAA